MPRDCIGCGYCCRKAPCNLIMDTYWEVAKIELSGFNAEIIWQEQGGCPSLEWDGERWRCGFVLHTKGKELTHVVNVLGVGEGCCASLNTYRVVGHVPTSEELEDEKSLLKQMGPRYEERFNMQDRWVDSTTPEGGDGEL